LAIQSVTTSAVSCFGLSDGEIAVTASGTNLSYSLDGTNWQSSNQFLNLTAANYTVYVRSQEGCVLTATNTSIAQPTQLSVQTTPSPLTSCIAANGSVTANVTGGTPGYTYNWTPNLGSGAMISNLTAGSYALQVTDQNGCQATSTAIVTANNTPQLTVASSSNVTCSGLNNGSATLQTTGGTAPYTYNWVPASIGNTNNPTNLSPGNYTATVTDAGSCTSTVSFSITAPTPLVITETITTPPCGSSTGAISLAVTGGSGNYNYTWNPPTLSGNTATNLSGGNYSVTVTDGNGCFVTENYAITPSGNLGLAVSPTSFSFNIGDTFSLAASTVVTNGVVISWAPNQTLSCDDCNTPLAYPTSDQTYVVYATSPDGCVDSIVVLASVIIPCTEIFVPTIFSPNGDGNNDVIGVFGNCIQELDFVIFNRWGQVVFQTTTQGETWDGYLQGKMAINDTYVYRLSIVDPTGKKINTSGNITLIR
jgi:gliding motility-associated-like protein